MNEENSPPGPARTGPWTLRCCVTAVCTRCGAIPLEEGTGLAPHFATPAQARQELARNWGWRAAVRSVPADDDELLCPACAAADAGNHPPNVGARGDQGPGTEPWWEVPRQPSRELPGNAAAEPVPVRGRLSGPDREEVRS